MSFIKKIKNHFKEILFIFYLLCISYINLGTILQMSFSFNLFIIIVLCILNFCMIFCILYFNSFLLRLGYGVLLFVASSMLLSYELIYDNYFTYHAFSELFSAIGFATEAFKQFNLQIIYGVSISSLLFIAILLKPKRYFFVKKNTPFFPLFFVLILLVSTIIRGDGVLRIRSPFQTIAYGLLFTYENINSENFIRKEVEIKIDRKHTINYDIVYIVDESIAPNYLDINSKYGISTVFTKPNTNLNLLNYGYATSISNCSASSNYVLRYGGTKRNYLKNTLLMPSIWSYAKKAGLKTVYIDAQRTGGKLQNFMSLIEKKDIDKHIQFDKVPIMYRDEEVARELIRLINNNEREFIYINKRGAHFPVNDKYPKEFELYTPNLNRNQNLGKSIQDIDWVSYRNSYRNTLKYSVDYFFKQVFAKANLNNAVMLYTSDHGQDLHESFSKNFTHCSTNPKINEGIVPLLVMYGNNINNLNFQKYYKDNINKSSHFNLFPTILLLMGYEKEVVRIMYGESLFNKLNEPLSFIRAGFFNNRFGNKPKFVEVKSFDLTIPPECLKEDFVIK